MFSLEFIGSILGLLGSLYGIYIFGYEKQKILRSKRWEKKIERYQKGVSSTDFSKWTLKIINNLYNFDDLKIKLVSISGKQYPSIFFLANSKVSSYPFSNLMKPLKPEDIQVGEVSYNKIQKEYAEILKGTIKRPKLIGYALNELEVNVDNQVVSVSSKTCNYEQNVMTSHILEYELYKLYTTNSSITKSSKEVILRSLPFRNRLHDDCSLDDIIFSGKGRQSLLSVQMIVLFKTKEGCYKVLLMQRSKDVAAKPGYWQFMPAGGFEMLEKEGVEDKKAIEDNYNVRMAIFRELIEELYGKSEYEYNVRGKSVLDMFRRDPHIKELVRLIEDRKVFMQFLGSAIDLVTLRHELSFILRIDDANFIENEEFKFDTNHEVHNMYEINIDQVEDYLDMGVMVPSNAALYEMAKQCDLFQEALKIHKSNM